VVGIDFGTSRTGYAYAFPSHEDTIVCKQPGGAPGDTSKTSTAILFDKHGIFKSFGNRARRDYADGDLSNLLFTEYKMNLNQAQALLNTATATASNGKTLPLMKVIAATLRFVKDDAMENINKNQPLNIKAEECKWVVTVPAIWSDGAKGFMRRAAFEAGLVTSENSSKLILALEPEAACIASEKDVMHLQAGHRFMILDCGGGTVDITMHQAASVSPLKLDEIETPSGGPWGSTKVDASFSAFVSDLMDWRKPTEFKRTPHFVEMMEAWETLKLGYDPAEDNDRSLSMSEILEFVDDMKMKDMVDTYNSRSG